MKEYTRVCARIDLDAIEYNMDQMHETVGDATKIMAVVKMATVTGRYQSHVI